MTMTATTLVIGRSRGRNSSLKNQIGNGPLMARR
jgi:hypothetical protein